MFRWQPCAQARLAHRQQELPTPPTSTRVPRPGEHSQRHCRAISFLLYKHPSSRLTRVALSLSCAEAQAADNAALAGASPLALELLPCVELPATLLELLLPSRMPDSTFLLLLLLIPRPLPVA